MDKDIPKIFVIEGSDGSGKQTQIDLLYKRLTSDGIKILRQSYPNYESDTSALVKMYLDGNFGQNPNDIDAYRTSSFYAVDRLGTHLTTVKPALDKGVSVLFDRYVSSNAYHQGCKITDIVERDKFLDWLYSFEFDILKLPRPTITFFLDMPYQKSIELTKDRQLKNGQSKDIHESDREHLKNAYETGICIAKKLDWQVIECLDEEGNIKTREAIHEEIYDIVKKFIT